MEELRRMREEAGLSQAQLARESGVDRATINKIEQGKRSPSIATLESLSRTLAVEMADFFPKAQAPLPDLEVRQRREYGSNVWERINLLDRAAEQWRRFLDEGLYDLKTLGFESLKVVDNVSLNILINHAPGAAVMKRAATDEQRERLEQAERRLIDTNLEFWARVERELARRDVAHLDEFRATRARWKEVLGSETA